MNNFNNYRTVRKCDYCGHYHDHNMECPLKRENKICATILILAIAFALFTIIYL